ncbi:SDR family oxidoreductase [Mesorhizobium sp.]|uniref:SDR family oxidoreductase n=1 Tax=unclassified Mesorhizobium TaxID=325217 RepID=UPI0032B01268
MYAVTGATGQLGRLVIEALLKTIPADRIVAAVRDPAKASDLTERGVSCARLTTAGPTRSVRPWPASRNCC